jgi:hypothetical protein
MPCLANNSNGVHYSQTAWGGDTSSTDVKLGDANTSTATFNTPYSLADLQATGAAGVRGRVVAVGVRFVPLAAVSNMGGLVSSLVDPDHADMNLQSITSMRNRAVTSTMRLNPNGHIATISPVQESELEYTSQGAATAIAAAYPFSYKSYSTADANVGNSPIKLAITSGVASQNFWVEVIMHCEFVGPLVGSAGTMSHVDPVGFAAVNAASNSIQGELAGKSVTPDGYVSAMRSAVTETLKEFTPSPATVKGHAKEILGHVGRAAYIDIGRRVGEFVISG